MPQIEVSIPDQIDSELDRLVEQGDFINRDQAIEELLSRGISAYTTGDEITSELDDSLFTQAVNDQQDPALQDDQQNDEYR